jgi:transposase
VRERVAGVDIARASGVVGTRVPGEDRPGRRKRHVRAVRARSEAVIELGGYWRARPIQVVTLESAGGYWRIWFVLLEAAGLRVQLVSAGPVRGVPGRAKDRYEGRGGAGQADREGTAAAVVRAAVSDRRVRELTRLRASLVPGKSGYRARLEKLPERALIKISAVLSTLGTALPPGR